VETNQVAFRKILMTQYEMIRRKNSAYSTRAFAEKIGVHSGALSEILTGKRRISRKLAERIVTKLGFDPQERAEALQCFPELPKPEMKLKESQYLKLTADQFRLISDWEHLAILSLMGIEGFNSSSQWIANRLDISEPRVLKAVSRLMDLGLIRLGEDGRLVRTASEVRTTDDIRSEALQKYYDTTLELGKKALHDLPVTERDFTSVVLKMNPKTLSMAKELIRKFQDEFGDLVEETGTPTEVYLLSMQFFPLTKVKR
jgi:uncharacterized protein (TIGR02147 family)